MQQFENIGYYLLKYIYGPKWKVILKYLKYFPYTWIKYYVQIAMLTTNHVLWKIINKIL